MSEKTTRCSIDGCDNKSRSRGMCNLHYLRTWKYGDPQYVVDREYPMRSEAHTGGYIMLRMPQHYLASKQGYVYEHRLVLFEAIGPGPHPCWCCGRPLTWGGRRPDSLVVDHRDRNPKNNQLENLRPCCNYCNLTNDGW